MYFGTAEQIALYIVLVFVLIFGLIAVALIFGIFFGLKKLNELIDTGLKQVTPVIDKTSIVLDTVNDVATNVGTHADTILTHGETISEKLAEQVDATANMVNKSVSSPFANIATILAGATKGFGAFGNKPNGGKSD